MTPLMMGLLGLAVAVTGVALIRFNRQFVNAVPAPRGPAADLSLFKPGATGRVPIVTIIGSGWIIFGLALAATALTK